MEKYSQYRDRATGIAPFLPISTPQSTLSSLTHTLLFLFRIPFFLSYALTYFLLLHPLPLPVIARKVALWGLMAVPGIWWIDLQLDGVKRGTLADQPRDRFPHPGSVIAANCTSPIDAVYLAAIFDPVFTVSWPGERRVRRVGLLGAVMAALGALRTGPPKNGDESLVELEDLMTQYPDRVIAVFPESGTTNGKAILPFSPSLLSAPPSTTIFPVSIRYTPSDVTTPVPGQWLRFLWNLLSRPTTLIRVRVAEGVVNVFPPNGINGGETSSELKYRGSSDAVSGEEQRMLDRVGEDLARLSRVKRVGLTMQDKAAFVTALSRKK